MSAKSSSNPRRVALFNPARKGQLTPRQTKWLMLIGLPVWVYASFIISQLLIIAVLWVIELVSISPFAYVTDAAAQTIISVLIYALTLALTAGVPYLLWRRKVTLETFGLQRLPTWSDIGLSPLAFCAYALAVSIIVAIVSQIPGYPADQAQEVGFKAFGSRTDNLLAFVTLVVLAPIAEEALFRGYLYGKLKKYAPGVIAAIITSVLFGIVHGQLNVAVDVFVLSMVLCGLRSLTGSIWAGVLVHMIKNAIAYYLLFISPLLGA
jgi:uncharacterized protein